MIMENKILKFSFLNIITIFCCLPTCNCYGLCCHGDVLLVPSMLGRTTVGPLQFNPRIILFPGAAFVNQFLLVPRALASCSSETIFIVHTSCTRTFPFSHLHRTGLKDVWGRGQDKVWGPTCPPVRAPYSLALRMYETFVCRLKPHKTHMRKALYRLGAWGQEGLSNLPKGTKEVPRRPRFGPDSFEYPKLQNRTQRITLPLLQKCKQQCTLRLFPCVCKYIHV